eukprot:5197693-Pyramimonas_sp.AAC.1
MGPRIPPRPQKTRRVHPLALIAPIPKQASAPGACWGGKGGASSSRARDGDVMEHVVEQASCIACNSTGGP